MRLSYRISILFTVLVAGLAAQPGNLGQIELSVTDRYKAQVSEATKISEAPRYQDSTTEKLPVNFSIRSQPLPVHFLPQPISPARVARVQVPQLYRGLIRAGFGFYTTPFAEAYFNSGRSSKSSYGFSGRHFSTRNGVENILYDDNALSRNHLGGYYTKHLRKFSWKTQLNLDLDKYSYYGNPTLDIFPEDSSAGEAPYNWYRRYGLQSSLIESAPGQMGRLQHLDIAYQFMHDNYRSQENDVQLSSLWRLPAQDENFNLELNGSWFQTSYDSIYTGADSSNIFRQSYMQFQARPYIALERENYSFDFGINLFLLERFDSRPDLASTSIYFFPEIHFHYKIIPEIFSLSAGMKGQLQRNTFSELTARTPYLLPGQSSRPTRDLDIWLQVEGSFSSRSSYSLRGGYHLLRDRALLYRQPWLGSDSARYGLEIEYADMGVFYAQGQLAYQLREMLRIDLSAIGRAIDMMSSTRPWHLPYFESRMSLNYKFREKLGTEVGLDAVGPRQAFDQLENPGISSMLPGYFDLTWKLEYRYNSRIAAFVNFSNLLNQQYDIFLGYRTQSINAMLGFNYRF